ncbi:glycosyl transferase [Capsulimonas corticalis]|uniref:Glycosyl transferase n=1 Tax=Capsulimonas corticalis TaxID=2219043 RepID=A0A402CXH1_9BACT|nr:glycosyltransferase family 2 protein [Capsulimonas corticalis]BDI32317.1 glycosyl transferase [Capsulimonas corticalis]
MLLSVCIVNWNTCRYLKECLASLREFPPGNAALEIIVADNASTDGSAEMVRAEFPEVNLIANADNKGYAEGNNQALRAATGDAVLLLNPDVVLHSDTLTQTVAFLQEHPDAGAVGCRLLSPDGSTQSSLRSFPDPLPVLWEYLKFSKLFPKSKVFAAYRMTYFDYDKPGEADQPMGTFLLIPRKALDQVGLLDEQFPIFFNEVDWCYRAKRTHGWKIYYTPATLTHYGGGSTRQVKPRMIRESHQSLLRFYEKHYRSTTPALLYSAITFAVRWNENRLLKRVMSEPATAPTATT